MDRLLRSLLAALCLLACTTSNPPATPATPAPTTALPAAPPPLTIRAPAEVILADSDVTLPRISGRDHVGIAQAASEQENQPLSLTEYRQWGWIEESMRSWAAGAARVDESLVLLTREDGATVAFQGWAAGLAQRGVCPDSPGMDQCAAGSGGLVARVGRYTFRLAGTGVDLGKLAVVQAGRIRRP